MAGKPERLIRNDRKVDRFALEEENEKQADIFGHYARDCAIQKETRDEKKKAYDKAVAQARIDIKSGKYTVIKDEEGKTIKLTKDDVDAMVILNEEVSKAHDAFIKAEGTYLKAKADESTMDMRRSSLNNLGDLYCKYYYENKDSNTAWSTKGDQRQDAQTTALNKKKKKEA